MVLLQQNNLRRRDEKGKLNFLKNLLAFIQISNPLTLRKTRWMDVLYIHLWLWKRQLEG
jgi:hypothetical protein